MEILKHYTIGAKSLLPAVLVGTLLTTLALWSSVCSASSTKTVNFNCEGWKVTLQTTGNNPVVASILPEDGTWVELPNNDPSGDNMNLMLLNIEHGKLAVMGTNRIGGVDSVFLQLYRDIDFYNAHQPQHSLRCTLDYGQTALNGIHH